MDVALHRGNDNGAVGIGGDACALRRGSVRAGCPSAVADEVETGLNGLGGGHELGQKEGALVVLLADDVEDGHEDVVDDGQTVVGLQQTFRGHRHRRAAPFQHAFSQVSDGFHRIGESARHRDGVAAWDPLRRGGACAAFPRGDRARGRGVGGDLVGIGRIRVGFQKCPAARILAVQDAERRHGVAVAGVQRVQNGHVEAGPEGSSEERAVHERPRWQTEADIRHAEHRAHAEALFHQSYRTQNLTHLILVGGGGHDEAVDGHVLARDAVSLGGSHNALGDGQALFGRGRDTVFVQREADHRATVARHHGQHGGEVVGLAVHGVHHGAARIGASRGFDGGRIR